MRLAEQEDHKVQNRLVRLERLLQHRQSSTFQIQIQKGLDTLNSHPVVAHLQAQDFYQLLICLIRRSFNLFIHLLELFELQFEID